MKQLKRIHAKDIWGVGDEQNANGETYQRAEYA